MGLVTDEETYYTALEKVAFQLSYREVSNMTTAERNIRIIVQEVGFTVQTDSSESELNDGYG